jgi:uncharacterized membrane protein
MLLLLIGLALWVFMHLMKRVAPGLHHRIESSAGPKGVKLVVALGIGLGLLLIIVGYRGSEFIPVYSPPPWTVHLNNLMMLAAVGLLGAGHSKGRVRSWFRNPMLLGTATWAVAHLLVNGDLASLLLFGGIGLWAVTSIVLINAQDEPWVRPAPGDPKRDLVLVAITLVVFAVIAAIHTWLGYWPFPG